MRASLPPMLSVVERNVHGVRRDRIERGGATVMRLLQIGIERSFLNLISRLDRGTDEVLIKHSTNEKYLKK